MILLYKRNINTSYWYAEAIQSALRLPIPSEITIIEEIVEIPETTDTTETRRVLNTNNIEVPVGVPG
jgi:hypothetical protein